MEVLYFYLVHIPLLYMCSNKILADLLNYKTYLTKKQFSDIINIFKESVKENEEDAKLIDEIVKDDSIKDQIFPKLELFEYEDSEFTFILNDYVSLLPKTNVENCHFTIDKELPSNLTFNKNTGEISGRVIKEISDEIHIIKCQHEKYTLSCELKISVSEIKFITDTYSSDIMLADNGKKCISSNYRKSICYLNIVLKEGIHHFEYEVDESSGSSSHFYFGATSKKSMSSDIYQKKSSLCFSKEGYSYNLYGSNGDEGDVSDLRVGDNLELIFDMDKKIFSIQSRGNNNMIRSGFARKINDKTILFRNFTGNLYPFVIPVYCSITLKRHWVESESRI